MLPLSDFASHASIEHDLMEREYKNQMFRTAFYLILARKWRKIASLLGLEPGEIESIGADYRTRYSCITAVFRRWFENAKNLSNAGKYPTSWQGLINLLEDAELGELAEKLIERVHPH